MTPPSFRSVVAAKRSPAVFTLKIVKAQMQRLGRGKVSFNAINQMNIELQEETANLDGLKTCYQRYIQMHDLPLRPHKATGDSY